MEKNHPKDERLRSEARIISGTHFCCGKASFFFFPNSLIFQGRFFCEGFGGY